MSHSRFFSSPYPYFVLTILLFTISHALSASPQLRPLFGCFCIKYNTIFLLPQEPNCSHSMYEANNSVQYFFADVRQPFTQRQRTPITLFHCIADIREYRCQGNLSGSKSKHFSVELITLKKLIVYITFSKHLSPYGPLFVIFISYFLKSMVHPFS